MRLFRPRGLPLLPAELAAARLAFLGLALAESNALPHLYHSLLRPLRCPLLLLMPAPFREPIPNLARAASDADLPLSEPKMTDPTNLRAALSGLREPGGQTRCLHAITARNGTTLHHTPYANPRVSRSPRSPRQTHSKQPGRQRVVRAFHLSDPLSV